jgi:hypothetical protein
MANEFCSVPRLKIYRDHVAWIKTRKTETTSFAQVEPNSQYRAISSARLWKPIGSAGTENGGPEPRHDFCELQCPDPPLPRTFETDPERAWPIRCEGTRVRNAPSLSKPCMGATARVTYACSSCTWDSSISLQQALATVDADVGKALAPVEECARLLMTMPGGK